MTENVLYAMFVFGKDLCMFLKMFLAGMMTSFY